MKALTSQQIRQMWLDFFVSKGHTIIPSASLIPFDDPTLLWINSGVAAIKRYFDGRDIPTHRRLTNAQKSLRTNDIEQVGYTSRHHTFFEMLGNFSIGDYFRKEAITWGLELLTSPQWFAIDKEKLYISYSPLDEETKRIWLSLGVDESHLIPLESNYWEIGEGPCGPDTEIYFDRGEKHDPQKQGVKLLIEELPNDRYVEIWNIVFSQFQSVQGVARKDYKELPNKNIDTGAGLERFACILQGTLTNFETDLFYPIIEATVAISKQPYLESTHRAYRVIADHIRTLTFTLSDGALFSNEGRGYVLRRILRRALRYGRKLNILQPFLSTLVPIVVNIMHEAYPNLVAQQARVQKMILAEEQKFMKTLSHGEALLKSALEAKQTIDGAMAFKLYDTYGFPIELTQEIVSEHGLTLDLEGFHALMEQQKQRARSSRSHNESMQKQSPALMSFTTPSLFLDHPLTLQAQVIGLFKDGEPVESLDEAGEVILDQTLFYAESGGQTFDLGRMENADCSVEVTSVFKAPNKQHLHHVTLAYGDLKVGDTLTLKLDTDRRYRIRKNHSSVHLLQASLKKYLGEHILQQGSFVGDDYARFDFSHPQKITEVELLTMEQDVNAMIQAAYPCVIETMSIAEAKKTGATAPFQEKYGEIVRVVTLGPRSKEFCGGTHVSNTEEIGVFAIVSEESIAAGTRRLTIVSSQKAYAFLKQKEQTLNLIRDQVKATSSAEILDRLKALQTQSQLTQKRLEQTESHYAHIVAQSTLTKVQTQPYAHVIVYEPTLSRPLVIQVMDALKVLAPQTMAIVIGHDQDNYPIGCFVPPLLQTPTRKANTVLKTFAQVLGGSGGGKPDLAFGSGKQIDNLDKAKLQALAL